MEYSKQRFPRPMVEHQIFDKDKLVVWASRKGWVSVDYGPWSHAMGVVKDLAGNIAGGWRGGHPGHNSFNFVGYLHG